MYGLTSLHFTKESSFEEKYQLHSICVIAKKCNELLRKDTMVFSYHGKYAWAILLVKKKTELNSYLWYDGGVKLFQVVD